MNSTNQNTFDESRRPFGAESNQAPLDGARDELDLVFVVESTSFMGDRWAELKDAIRDALNDLEHQIRRPRIGLIAYKDHCQKSQAPVLLSQALSQRLSESLRLLNDDDRLKPGEGGSERAQALECALHLANEQNWRPKARRAVVLIGACPPHGGGCDSFRCCSEQRDYRDEVEYLKRSGVRVYSVRAGESLEAQRVFEWVSAETSGVALDWRREGELSALLLGVMRRECGQLGRYQRQVRSTGRVSASVAAMLEALAA